jgi:hypothetical protein
LKNETKKLLDVIGNVKKAAVNESNKYCNEVVKLAEEVTMLKESKNLLEKKLRNCTCTSVGAKGTKSATSNNDAKVDQIIASAKAEIQKLVSHEFVKREIMF